MVVVRALEELALPFVLVVVVVGQEVLAPMHQALRQAMAATLQFKALLKVIVWVVVEQVEVQEEQLYLAMPSLEVGGEAVTMGQGGVRYMEVLGVEEVSEEVMEVEGDGVPI